MSKNMTIIDEKITYPINGNPICPMDKKDCDLYDMDGYTDCNGCPRFCNGVRATGGMPGLLWAYNGMKKIIKK